LFARVNRASSAAATAAGRWRGNTGGDTGRAASDAATDTGRSRVRHLHDRLHRVPVVPSSREQFAILFLFLAVFLLLGSVDLGFDANRRGPRGGHIEQGRVSLEVWRHLDHKGTGLVVFGHVVDAHTEQSASLAAVHVALCRHLQQSDGVVAVGGPRHWPVDNVVVQSHG
jgi:hypothetical protein